MATMQGTDRALRELARSMTSRCRSPALLAGGGPHVGTLLREWGLQVVEGPAISDPAFNPPSVGQFNTVVPWSLVEGGALTEPASELTGAWELLAPGGRLVVAAPNRDALSGRERENGLTDRELKRALRQYGRPRFVTAQPFRWLLAFVEKPHGSRASVPGRAPRARYRVTAKLCRGRVLDLGCGQGYLAGMLHERGLKVVGVDLNAGKIAAARRLHPGIPFLRSDIREVDLPDESFDTVVLAEVLEHVGEEVGAEILNRAARLLHPGGRLVVSVPNREFIPHANHVRTFDRRALKRLLQPIGPPQLVVDQPFQWLMMWVTKGG